MPATKNITGQVFKHGYSRSPIYACWAAMIQRCTNPKNPGWRYYGAKGVTVCNRWRMFENFLADVGLKPTAQHSIGRFGDVGNYEPGNCAWQTLAEQRTEQNIKRGIVHKLKLCSFIAETKYMRALAKIAKAQGLSRAAFLRAMIAEEISRAERAEKTQ